MLKPLFIDNDYQLLNSASGQIARNFWEHQDEKDFQPTIVCTPANFDFKSRWKTIEVPNRYKIWYLGVGFKKFGLPGFSLLPDMYRFSWNPFVRRAIKNVDFDYIHTLSSPNSTHMLGLELKRKTGKPWVAQFNDPWTDSSGRMKHAPQFTARIERGYEKEVVENADLIIHTNHILADIWNERYGVSVKKKMVVIPLNFNIVKLPDYVSSQEKSDVLKIAHIGEIYSTRSCADFLKGLKMYIDLNSENWKKIHVTFVGGIKKEESGLIKALGLEDVVETTPRLAPEQLEKYYNESDVFLAIDVNLRRSPSFPSKLMMYYYYCKPILGISNPGSIMEEEMSNSGNTLCYYGHPEEVAEYLNKAVSDYDSLNTFDKDYWKRYTVENVSSIYSSLIKKL